MDFDRVKYGVSQLISFVVVVMIDVNRIRERFSAVAPFFDDRPSAGGGGGVAAGYGGITAVAAANGMALKIGRGLKAEGEPSGPFGGGEPGAN